MTTQTKTERPALVVGASSGVGLACVRQLSTSLFAPVFSASRSGSEVLSPISRYIHVDVTDDDSVRSMIDQVLSESSKIDLLVYSVGYVLSGPIEDTTVAEAMQQFDTNFWGMVRVVQAALPSMRDAGGGTIILVGSLGGVIPLPFQSYYSASKFAMEAYSEALSYEVAPHGIRIGLVQPGDLCTPFTSKRRRAENCTPSSSYHERFQRCMANVESMETKGQAPEKVADAILRMASNRRMPLRRRVTQPLEELFLFLRHYGPSPIYHRVLRSVVGDGS